MEENEVILIEVKLSEEDVAAKLKGLVEIKARITKELKDLEKEQKSGIITAKEYAQSYVSLKGQLSNVNAEIRTNQKALTDYAKIQKAAEGSLDQMRAQLALATPQLTAMSKAEREAASGQALQKHIKGLSDELKNEEKALGDNRRQVGSYSEAIEQAITGQTTWSNSIQQAVGNVKGLYSGLNNLPKTIKEGATNLTQYASGLRETAKGMTVAEGGTKLFGVALKALPIFFVIAAITTLVSFLTATDAGMDTVDRTFARVTETVSTFARGIAPLGKLLVDIFTAPQDVIKNLTEKTGVYSVSLSDVAKKANDAGIAAAAYKQVLNDLEDAQDQLVGKQALVKEQVDLALLQVKERTKSEAERIAILDKAGVAERELATEVLENERKKTVATQLNVLQRVLGEQGAIAKIKELREEDLLNFVNNNKQLTDEQKKQFNESYAGYVQARQATEEVFQQIKNRRSTLLEQEAAEDKAAAEKAKENAKKRAQASVDEAEAALVMAKRKGEDTVEIEQELLVRQLKLIDVRTAAEKAAVDKGIGYSQKIKLIEQKAITERLEAAKAAAIKISEFAYNAKINEVEASLALTRHGSKEELELQIKTINANRVKQTEEARQNIKDKDKLLDEVSRIELTSARTTSDARLAYAKGEVALEAEMAERRLQFQIDTGDNSLENERDVAAERIKLEEKTQLELLKLEDEYGQLADSEFLNRKNLIQAKAIAAQKELNKQIADADLNNEKAINDAKLIVLRDGSKAQLNVILDNLAIERQQKINAAKGDAKAIQAIEDDYNNKKAKANQDYQKKLADQIVEIANQATATLSSIVDAQVASQTATLDQQHDAEISSAALSADARAKIDENYQRKKDAIDFAANEKRKKIATAQNFINGAVAITKAFADLGPIGGAIATALIAAQVIAQQVVIDNQKFAEGGVYHSDGRGAYVKGPGTGTSDSINARISNGESILTAKATSMFYPQLSAMNVAGGGRAFPGLGSQVLFDTKHALPTYSMGGVNVASVDSDAIADAVERGIARANIGVAVTDIRKVDKDMKYVEVGADHTYSKRS